MPADFDGLTCPRCGAGSLAPEEGHRYCSYTGGDTDAPCSWGLGSLDRGSREADVAALVQAAGPHRSPRPGAVGDEGGDPVTAADLVGTEHARGCGYGRPYSVGDTSAAGSCTCRLAERQAQARAIDARVAALEAALRDLRPMAAEDAQPFEGYGYYRPENPHDFHPDAECCSTAEMEAHAAACEAYDRGERDTIDSGGCDEVRDADGNLAGHALRAPWGIGSYSVVDPDAVERLARIDALLAGVPRG